MQDIELELLEQRRKREDLEESTGGWNAVDIDDKPVDIRVCVTHICIEYLSIVLMDSDTYGFMSLT